MTSRDPLPSFWKWWDFAEWKFSLEPEQKYSGYGIWLAYSWPGYDPWHPTCFHSHQEWSLSEESEVSPEHGPQTKQTNKTQTLYPDCRVGGRCFPCVLRDLKQHVTQHTRWGAICRFDNTVMDVLLSKFQLISNVEGIFVSWSFSEWACRVLAHMEASNWHLVSTILQIALTFDVPVKVTG